MAIPPGNKQIGQVMLQVTYGVSSLDSTTAVSCHSMWPAAVVRDPSQSSIAPQAYKNVMVGQVSLALTTAVGTATSIISVHSLLAVAVIKYSPPTSLSLEQFVTCVTVKDTLQASHEVQAPLNVMIGQVAVHTTYSLDPNTILMWLQQFVVIAVVRKFNPRHEHVTMNIEYAANAKLNTEDLL